MTGIVLDVGRYKSEEEVVCGIRDSMSARPVSTDRGRLWYAVPSLLT